MTEQDIRNIAIEAVAEAFEMQAELDDKDRNFLQGTRCRVFAGNIRTLVVPAEDEYPRRIIANLREQVQSLAKERDEARKELAWFKDRLGEIAKYGRVQE